MKNGKLDAAVKLLTTVWYERWYSSRRWRNNAFVADKAPWACRLFSEETVLDIEPVASHAVVSEEVNAML